MVLAVSPDSTRNSTWVGLARHRGRQGRPEVLADDVLDERQGEGGRVVLGEGHDRAGDDRPERGQGHGQDDHGEDEREDQELQQADDAVAAAATAAAPRDRGTGSENSGMVSVA